MAVLWMERYLFYCSVRLGLIVGAVFAFVQMFIPIVLLLSLGIGALDPLLKLIKNDEQYGKNDVVLKILNNIENHAQGCIALFVTILTVHMICCILAIFGALKLKKWFLLPFIIIEFIRVCLAFATHIIIMIILKKKLSLGLLIAFTLFGGFILLYFVYNWATSVALFQIIELIHTKRYRQLYGDDPFNLQLPSNYSPFVSLPLQQYPGYGTVENVRVLITPRSGDVDEQKLRQTQKIPVIAVLPANYKNNNLSFWQNKQVIDTEQQALQSRKYKANNLAQNDYNIDNGNWQWSELMVGRQRGAMISRNY